MTPREINVLIRENASIGISKVTQIVVEEEIMSYFCFTYRNSHLNRAEFFGWAKSEGMYKGGTPNDFEMGNALFSARFLDDKLIVHDLEIYGSSIATINLKYKTVDEVKCIINNLPQLFKALEFDKDYIAKNFEKIILKSARKDKDVSTKQAIIKAFISDELDKKGLKYTFVCNKARLYLIVEAGRYEINYPITNGMAMDMPTILQHILDFVKATENVPFGLKIKASKK